MEEIRNIMGNRNINNNKTMRELLHKVIINTKEVDINKVIILMVKIRDNLKEDMEDNLHHLQPHLKMIGKVFL